MKSSSCSAVLLTGIIAVSLLFACGCSQRARQPKVNATSTSISELGKQLQLPDSVTHTCWGYSSQPDNLPVPSPGATFLIGTVSVSTEEMSRIRQTGDWDEVTYPAGMFDSVVQPGDEPTMVLENVSQEPRSSFIYKTTWMSITLHAHPSENTLYFVARKS